MKKRRKRLFEFEEVESQVEGKSKAQITEKKHALEISIKDGTAFSFAEGIGSSFITPFALALKSTASQIGILSALSTLVPTLGQWYGSKKMENVPRKKLFIKFLILELILWIPLIAIGYAFYKGMSITYLPYILIILYSTITFTGGVRSITWFSWMGDLVPPKLRGDYFGKRYRITTFVSVMAFIIGAFILDFFETRGFVMFGFITIFAISVSIRSISYFLIRKQYSPEIKIRKKDEISFREFLTKKTNYRTYAFYRAVSTFAVMIAGPFFAVYMINELGFSYITYTSIFLSASVFFLLVSPLIGKFADRFGSVKLLYTHEILAVAVPILWIFFKSPLMIILAIQTLAGIKLSALTTGTTNMTYDSLSPKQRGIVASYVGLLIGIGSFIGSLSGGLILDYVSFGSFNSFFALFIISAAARALAGIIFLPRIKEPTPKERLPPIKVNVTHPFKTINADIGWLRAIFR